MHDGFYRAINDSAGIMLSNSKTCLLFYRGLSGQQLILLCCRLLDAVYNFLRRILHTYFLREQSGLNNLSASTLDDILCNQSAR